MRNWILGHILGFISLWILLLSETCIAGVQYIGKIDPGTGGTQMNWIDRDGLFLRSNNSEFGFGFITTQDVSLFILGIVHIGSTKVIWSANRDNPVSNSDKFLFDKDGNVVLQKGGTEVWKLDNAGKGVSAMELQDSGNLALISTDGNPIWESFGHPTDTLISNQNFSKGMKLSSNPQPSNLSYILQISSGDLILSANSSMQPQPYWSMGKERRKIINKNGGDIDSASLNANSWRFFDKDENLLLQFMFSDDTDENGTWIAVLGNDGFISFYKLGNGRSSVESPTKIPNDLCSTPKPCDLYSVCLSNSKCQCPSEITNCKTGVESPCGRNKSTPVELVSVGDGNLGYFALGFVPPSSKNDLDGCKSSCASNCSCLGLFFRNNTGDCFLFDWIGSFQTADKDSGFVSYVKLSSDRISNPDAGENSNAQNHFPYVVIIVLATVFVIVGLIFTAFWIHKKKKKLAEPILESSEEEDFLGTLTGMPVRFAFKDLQSATDNFSVKLGQGGFGSVYKGILPDGTLLAVKKLEGIGQGKKEFRAEVGIIGSIHHLHLVRLRGFCAEGTHRLLAYEFMANGSLDKWIFQKSNSSEFPLDWDTRFNIAVETAKGLAYLHEDCDSRIVHCDIKPENILLDDHFHAKVSDFGLAKLISREQSHVFTTMRGTRGYLAPEWITNYAISEKSDVYSYGMVLLEIIGGRKNYDPKESSEKLHFPSYAFKMMEEGKLKQVLDSRMKFTEDIDERVNRAVKVALWCIQEDMHSRPSMTKVVQMLEGIFPVTHPPVSSPLGSRLYSGLFKSISEGGTSSGPSDCNSDAYLSAVRLSGPR